MIIECGAWNEADTPVLNGVASAVVDVYTPCQTHERVRCYVVLVHMCERGKLLADKRDVVIKPRCWHAFVHLRNQRPDGTHRLHGARLQAKRRT